MAMNRGLRAFLLIALLSSQAFAADGSIAGKVTGSGESQNEPLVGATIFLQGTVRGTTTNTKGEFKLTDVPPGLHTIVVSMVGYQRGHEDRG